MFIETKNSTYRIGVAKSGRFIVTKVAENKPNRYGMNVGWEKEFDRIDMQAGKGCGAAFYNYSTPLLQPVYTSEIVKVWE